MRKIKFSQKLWIPLFVSLIALIGISIFNAYQIRQVRIDERKNLLISVSTQALNLVKQFDDLAKSGAMTEEQAKKLLIERFRLMRYQGNGYFTITNSQNFVIMHPIKRELEGKDQSDFKDPIGTPVYVPTATSIVICGPRWVARWPSPSSALRCAMPPGTGFSPPAPTWMTLMQPSCTR